MSSDERPVLCTVHVGVKGHLKVLSKQGKHTFTHSPAGQTSSFQVSTETLRAFRTLHQLSRSPSPNQDLHHSCRCDSFHDTSGGSSEVEGEAEPPVPGEFWDAKYVKNYLSSCFMICSGGVCFKVLPGDWKCVTKTQTHGALKRRNCLICLPACVCAPRCTSQRADTCI